jgi:hypothetical protein
MGSDFKFNFLLITIKGPRDISFFVVEVDLSPDSEQSSNLKTCKEPRNQFQGIGSASLCTCSLAGRYDKYRVAGPSARLGNDFWAT